MYKRFGELSREEQLDIVTYWLDTGRIEVLDTYSNRWYTITMPAWQHKGYFRKPLTKPSVNWDHVAKEYNYMATDKSGATYLYKLKPHKSSSFFNSESYRPRADTFASFVKGTCDWENSLVKRPEQQQ